MVKIATIKGPHHPLSTMMKSSNYRENLLKLPPLNKNRLDKLCMVERKAIANFAGQLPELSSALGLLHMGDQFGWRALLIIYNKHSIRKYEDILDIKVKEFFPETGPSAERSIGYYWAAKLGGYWKIVNGDVYIENRQKIL